MKKMKTKTATKSAVFGADEKRVGAELRAERDRKFTESIKACKPTDLKDALASSKLWSNAREHAGVVKAVTEAAEEIERVKATLAALREKQERCVLALARGYRKIVAS